MARNISRVRARAGTRSEGLEISVHVVAEDVARVDDAFKAIRRDVNARMRDVMQQVGERDALPAVRTEFATTSRRFADTLYVVRDRSGVFIGSRARGPLNRAVGWLDFGGKRERDHETRVGPYTIVHTLDQKRPAIDAAILEGLCREFEQAGFEVT